MFESFNKKSGLTAKVQAYFAKQKQIQQLGIAGGSFASTPKQNIATPPQISFIDTRRSASEPTTQRGSLVPSPQLHDLLEASWSMELSKRLNLYQEIDRIVYSNTIIYQAEKDLIDIAFSSKGYTTTHEPSKAVKAIADRNPDLLKRAQAMCDALNPVWQKIESKQKLKKKKARARAYLRYGNLPIRLISTKSAGIIDYTGLPPHAMKINVDHNLQFIPNQFDAYQQFDAFNINKLIASWPESGVAWCGNFELEWLIYGVPCILSGLGECRSLIRSKGYIDDARGWAQPKKYLQFGDIANNPIDPQNLSEAQYNTREEKARRGESIHGFEEEIINGFLKDVKMVAPTTDYFSKLDDVIFNASAISSLFGMNMARKLNPESITRSTMEKIDEFVYANADNFLLDLVSETDEKISERVISEINRLTIEEREAQGLEDPTLLIDPDLVELVVSSNAPKVPERLNEDANMSIGAYKSGLLPRDMAIEIVCKSLNLDHTQAILLLDQSKAKPKEDPNDLLDDLINPDQSQDQLNKYLQ